MVPAQRRRGLTRGHRSRLASRARRALLALVVVALPAAAETVAEKEWKAAFDAARQEKRLVFVDFFASWCRPCKEMDRQVFPRDDVRAELAKFVTLRVDVDKAKVIARSKNLNVLPTYAIYDPRERQVVRFTGFVEPALFRDSLHQVAGETDAFVRASELLDAGNELDAAFAAAGAFMRMKMTADARSALSVARHDAEQHHNKARAQMATIQEAFTYRMDGKTEKAVAMLQELVKAPADATTAAIAWLSLGEVYRLSMDVAGARDAYTHVKSIVPPDSDFYKQAEESLKKLP